MSAQYRPSASSRGGQRSRYTPGYSGDTGGFTAQRIGRPGDTGSFSVQRDTFAPRQRVEEGFRGRRDPQRSAYAGVSDVRPRSGTSPHGSRGAAGARGGHGPASGVAGTYTSGSPRRGHRSAPVPGRGASATRPRDHALARTSSGGRGGSAASSRGAHGTSYGDRSAAAVRGRKDKGGRAYVVLGIVALVLALLAGIGMAAYSYVKNIDDNLHSGVNTSGLSNVLVERTSSSDPFYVLLMGTDGREGESTFRSDSIILARVDPVDVQVTLISIPRDTYVDLEGYGPNKINAARAYGGPELAVSTVAEFAGVDITHYIEVSFSGFNQIVDSLGGVEIDVPETFYDEYLDEGLDAGVQVLDGEQALVFCRSRHPFANGDYARSEHQRMFIVALARKILASDAVTMASTITTISQYVTTDMQLPEIISLANQFKGIDVENGVYSAVVPSNTSTIDGVSYVIAEESEWKAMMQRVESGQAPTDGTSSTTLSDTANASDEKTEVMQ